MSIHLCVIAIEGDHTGQAADIFGGIDGYRIEKEPQIAVGREELEPLIQNVDEEGLQVKKVVYQDNGWTRIMDFEMAMYSETALWEELSKRWSTRIFCSICEGASETYAFSLYERGHLVRSVFYCGGEMPDDTGKPIPEEKGIDWQHASERDVLALAERIGAPYERGGGAITYRVYTLDESHMQHIP